jgi:hypothetical protein
MAPDGNDSNAGTTPAAALLTCAGAIEWMEMHSAADRTLPAGGVEVRIAPGMYNYNDSTACCLSVGCKGTPLTGTKSTPIVFRGMGATNAAVVFDGSLPLDASLLQPVTNTTIKAIINPAAKNALLVMPLTTPPSTILWNGVPLTPSRWYGARF